MKLQAGWDEEGIKSGASTQSLGGDFGKVRLGNQSWKMDKNTHESLGLGSKDQTRVNGGSEGSEITGKVYIRQADKRGGESNPGNDLPDSKNATEILGPEDRNNVAEPLEFRLGPSAANLDFGN